MKRIKFSILLASVVVFTSCKNETQTAGDRIDENTTLSQEDTTTMQEETKELNLTMEPRSGSKLSGTVTFTQEDGEVMMKAELMGLSEGEHAIHLHENADCSADDGTSAGGHWNPTFEDHGKWGADEGYHKGDIGNFEADADGKATVTFSTDEWCIGCDDEKMNILNKSVIVHDGVDDFTSQPSGDAGTRIGCAEIKE